MARPGAPCAIAGVAINTAAVTAAVAASLEIRFMVIPPSSLMKRCRIALGAPAPAPPRRCAHCLAESNNSSAKLGDSVACDAAKAIAPVDGRRLVRSARGAGDRVNTARAFDGAGRGDLTAGVADPVDG